MDVRTICLGILTRGDATGYEIKNLFQNDGYQHFVEASFGSIYPALNRLEDRGWVDSYWATSENNRRARYYRLTPKGRRQLLRESEQWQQLVRAIGLVMRPVED